MCYVTKQCFLHRDVLKQIINHWSYSLLARKTRKQALLERSGERHARGRRAASALRVHTQAAGPGQELGGWACMGRRVTRKGSQALTPVTGQPVCT